MESGNRSSEQQPGKSEPPKEGASAAWLGLLGSFGRTVGPVLLTAGGFVGFLAFAGSVIVWTRYQAAHVPPDQVVAVYPRGELVAVASALLLIFGFVGVLAVLTLFLISPKGEASIGVSRGLLGLLAVEGLAAIFLVDRPWDQDKVLALELFMLPLFVALWATFLYEREDFGEVSQRDGRAPGFSWMEDTLQDILPDYVSRSAFAIRTILIVSITVVVSLVLAIWIPFQQVAIGALAVICVGPTAWLVWKLAVTERPKTRTLETGEIPFERSGQVLIGVLLLVGAIVPSLLLGSNWLPFSLIAAVILIAAVWRVAVITKSFMWFGLAVFISVPLFGTITGIVRNVDDPQVQPVALIREEDGPDEAIQGIYVTETDSRVYFATVATEGCTNELVPHSGRLLWVPKSEVVAMSVGPSQSIDDAARTALEMSYALTPAVETPAGDNVSLTVAEKRGESQSEESDPQARRLENVGPAVQPNFGRGLRLAPENASPGDVVTLQMTAPNEEVEGFGASRQGRTLRIGGVPVDIVKEEARSPFEAEYVESSDGHALRLARNRLYVKEGEDYVEVHDEAEAGEETLFVKLADESVAEVAGSGVTEEGYLRLATAADEPPRLDVSGQRLPAAELEDGTSLTLSNRLLRQDWHRDRIRFRVPDHASTAPITVECDQLAGQPLLRVARPPEARISVQIEPGSHRVVFDSSRSGDNSRIVSRHWRVEGIDRGREMRIGETMPPRPQSYLIRLTVIDNEGQTGSTELRLLRLSTHLLSFEQRRPEYPRVLAEARAELQRATIAEPTAVEFDMRSGELPDPPKPSRTIRRVERIRKILLKPGVAGASPLPAEPDGLVVKTLAFGSPCPAERESRTGRLDVLVLGDGVRVVPPQECPIVRKSTARWLPSTP